jgi:hypothetical protein
MFIAKWFDFFRFVADKLLAELVNIGAVKCRAGLTDD